MICFLIYSIISMYHWLLFVNIPSSKAAGKFPAAIWHHIQLWLPAPALYCFPVYPGQMLLYPAKLPGDSVLRHTLHLRDLFLHIGARYHKLACNQFDPGSYVTAISSGRARAIPVAQDGNDQFLQIVRKFCFRNRQQRFSINVPWTSVLCGP